MAAPAHHDSNRFRRSLSTASPENGSAAAVLQEVRERLRKVEQLQTAGKTAEAVAELLVIAEAYAGRGAPAKAVAVLRQAAKLQPESAHIRVALGDVQQQLRMVEDAARDYATAFELYERSKQFADMMQVLGRLLEMDPENLAGQLELAEHLVRAGHHREGAELLRTLAATLLRKGSVADWEKVAERAFALDPSDTTLAHDLALHLVRDGRPALALGKLLRCYEAVPNDGELFELIIDALEQLGQNEKAAVICRQLIRTCERNGLTEEANHALERLFLLAPDDERARAYMGILAPSVQGGTVIELQPGNIRPSGITALDEAVGGETAAVTKARSRPGTMALPEEDLERLQAAIARQAAEAAAAAAAVTPELHADMPPLPGDGEGAGDWGPPPVPLAEDDATQMLQVPVEAYLPSAAVAARPVPAPVRAVPVQATQPTAAPSVQSTQRTAAPTMPMAPSAIAPHAVAQRPVAPTSTVSATVPAVSIAPAPAAPLPMKPTVDLTPHRQVSQSLRATHQPAVEALSELDDLEAADAPAWADDDDDEAGFDTSERTLVEHIAPDVLERHGLRMGDVQPPAFTMPPMPRASQPPPAAETTWNPVAPASARSNILPRPRLARAGGTPEVAPVATRDMSRDLGTLDFFIERGFRESAVALLDALEQRHPGAPELANYRARIQQMRPDGQ